MNSVPDMAVIDLAMARHEKVGSLEPAMIKVSIVEDDARLRETVVRYLAGQSGFRCLNAYANAENALDDIPAHLPDVVLMDINLPGITGIECVARLRQIAPSVKIIMLTVFEEGEQVFQALSAGALVISSKATAQPRFSKRFARFITADRPCPATSLEKWCNPFKRTMPPVPPPKRRPKP